MPDPIPLSGVTMELHQLRKWVQTIAEALSEENVAPWWTYQQLCRQRGIDPRTGEWIDPKDSMPRRARHDRPHP